MSEFNNTNQIQCKFLIKSLAIITFAIVSVVSEFSYANEAFDYKGVPYISEPLPNEILPEIPDGADPDNICWSKYDPIVDLDPIFAGAINQFYVDSSSNNETAGNSGRGSLEDPLDSLTALPFFDERTKTWTVPAGTHVFIAGNGNKYLNNGSNYKIRWQCNDSEPCYFIGLGEIKPLLRPDQFYMGGSDYILTNLDFYQSDDAMRLAFGNGNVSSSLRGVLKNSVVRGLGTTVSGNTLIKGAGINASDRTKCTLIYNNIIKDNGKWDNFEQGDAHGIHFTFYLSYTWIINNEIFHHRGDSIQSGVGTRDLEWAKRQHYTYIAGNSLYENGENGYDDKQTAHVIISQNEIYNIKTFNKPADATAVLLSNNTEGPQSNYNWFIFNQVYNKPGFDNSEYTIGIRDSGTTDGERNFILGNTVEGFQTGLSLANNGVDRESWWIHNSVRNCAKEGLVVKQRGTNAKIIVRRNIFSNCNYINAGGGIELIEGIDNLLHNTIDQSKWTIESGTILGDPMFTNPTSDIDFSVSKSSPSIAATSDDSAFDLFYKMYGIKLIEGISGTNRDIGAYNLLHSTNDLSAPNAPSNISVEIENKL